MPLAVSLGLLVAASPGPGLRPGQSPRASGPRPAPSTLTHDHDSSFHLPPHDQRLLADRQPAMALRPLAYTPCVNGFADIYPCSHVDLLSFLPLADIGGGEGSSIWGWTDLATNKEYALMGRSSGTAFVDITDPVNPVYVGDLPTETYDSSWREMKTFRHFALIVCDLCGAHGMQIFDLTRLRGVSDPPVTFDADAHYLGFGTAHTLTVNEETGFAYANGGDECGGGLHFVDLQDPLNPTYAGCFWDDGYTHDSQCVIYRGPDLDYQGREVCFASNEDSMTIVDVTDKANPVMISRTTYSRTGYTHQGWLTENHRLFALDDELDEILYGFNTRTRYFRVTDLDAPVLQGVYSQSTPAIDHNLFFRGNLLYQSNYRAGLRIISPPNTEVGYFDIYPANDAASFNGAWSNYPFFASGVVIVSGIEQGLFVLQPNPTDVPQTPGWDQ